MGATLEQNEHKDCAKNTDPLEQGLEARSPRPYTIGTILYRPHHYCWQCSLYVFPISQATNTSILPVLTLWWCLEKINHKIKINHKTKK